jgi:hypothetical protein
MVMQDCVLLFTARRIDYIDTLQLIVSFMRGAVSFMALSLSFICLQYSVELRLIL